MSATGGASGNPVTFTSTSPTVCTVAGTSVTLLRTGTCTIAPAGSRLTLAANRPAISAGQAVTVTATLRTTAGKPLPNSRILLCGVPDVLFTTCQYLTTGSAGTARVAVKPWISTTYRAAYARTRTVRGSTSNTARVALRTTYLSLGAAPTTVRPGGQVTLRAQLKTDSFKPLAGGKVLICGKPAVGWTYCWYTTTCADGIALGVVRPATTTTYIAGYAGTKTLDPSRSLPVTVSVRR